MFSYRSILKQAISIAWKHKYLWFFGLFASLAIAGSSTEYQFLTQSFSQGIVDGSYQNLNNLLALSELFNKIQSGILNLFNQNIIVIINALTTILLTLTIIAVFVWLAISSQAGLVDSVKKIIIPKKKINSLSIRDGLSVGSRHFWSVLSLNILIKILTSFAIFIIGLPLLFLVLDDNRSFIIAYTFLFVIFIPVSVSLSFIIKYAISYRVLENESFVNSLEKAWKLFKKNWLISLELALILFIISFLASVILLLLISVIFFPLIWFGLSFSINWLIFFILFLIFILIVFFGSFLTTFQITVWTDLFLHLINNKGIAKLERIFQKK